MKRDDNLKISGVILYDDTCGLCTHTIARYAAFLEKIGFSSLPLQDPSVKNLTKVGTDEMMKEIHLITHDGVSIIAKGPDVARVILSKIWWLLPIYWLSKAPFVRSLFDYGYQKYANNRHAISEACGLNRRY